MRSNARGRGILQLMASVLTPEIHWLAHGVSIHVERLEDGDWLADDPEVECTAVGGDPLDAIASLLDAEAQYLAILRAEGRLSPLTAGHLGILKARESACSVGQTEILPFLRRNAGMTGEDGQT